MVVSVLSGMLAGAILNRLWQVTLQSFMAGRRGQRQADRRLTGDDSRPDNEQED
jgi:hypothetical protein